MVLRNEFWGSWSVSAPNPLGLTGQRRPRARSALDKQPLWTRSPGATCFASNVSRGVGISVSPCYFPSVHALQAPRSVPWLQGRLFESSSLLIPPITTFLLLQVQTKGRDLHECCCNSYSTSQFSRTFSHTVLPLRSLQLHSNFPTAELSSQTAARGLACWAPSRKRLGPIHFRICHVSRI